MQDPVDSLPEITVPDHDVHRVLEWAGHRLPPDYVEELRLEVDVSPGSITVVECRPPWDSPGSSLNWSRSPIARMRYAASRGTWTLYWRDRHGRFHRYDRLGPSESISDLLTEIDEDPTGIFWG